MRTHSPMMSGIPVLCTPLATAPTLQTPQRKLLTLIILYDDYHTRRQASESLIQQHTTIGWGRFLDRRIDDISFYKVRQIERSDDRDENVAARQSALAARRNMMTETAKLMRVKRRLREIVPQLVRYVMYQKVFPRDSVWPGLIYVVSSRLTSCICRWRLRI